MKFILTYEIDYALWGPKEILDEMTDKEVLELLAEDWSEILDNSEKNIVRDIDIDKDLLGWRKICRDDSPDTGAMI